MFGNVKCNRSCVELKTKLIDMEEIILKELIKNRSLDTCNDFVIWANKSDLQPLAKKIAEAITVTHCCETFYCKTKRCDKTKTKQCDECALKELDDMQ